MTNGQQRQAAQAGDVHQDRQTHTAASVARDDSTSSDDAILAALALPDEGAAGQSGGRARVTAGVSEPAPAWWTGGTVVQHHRPPPSAALPPPAAVPPAQQLDRFAFVRQRQADPQAVHDAAFLRALPLSRGGGALGGSAAPTAHAAVFESGARPAAAVSLRHRGDTVSARPLPPFAARAQEAARQPADAARPSAAQRNLGSLLSDFLV